MAIPECKICRRQGIKLFLKGERCFSPKCALIKKPYAPGQKLKSRRKSLSEYGKELREKQILKNWYNLKERQFAKYINQILEKRGKVEDAGNLLIKKIASRLDNVVFSLGFATSRKQARQQVCHNHFLVNEKKVNTPSFQVKKGDIIKLSEGSRKKKIFENIEARLKKHKFPSWVEFDAQNLEAKIISDPFEETEIPVEISKIFEYYSR